MVTVTPPLSSQDLHLQQAKTSIQQALNWFASVRRHWNYPPNQALQTAIRPELQALKSALDKVEESVFKIATFGLVSRGKSAVINALMGQSLLPTGPLHGVTQWPQFLRWQTSEKIHIDLIDTPGLDEVAGDVRSEMAQTIAQQADLILFVVAGDITRTEYEALVYLADHGKPMILVFNKIDLYPEQDRQAIYQQLQQLAARPEQIPLLSTDDIVCVAAEPRSEPLRLEFTDRPDEEIWETPAPLIDPLRQKILEILNHQGRSLLALNALVQTQAAEQRIAEKTRELRDAEAEAMIWKYAQYKSLAIAINPIAVLDLVGGVVTDLFLIRALARLYGLPITSFEAGKLWQKILVSSGGIIVSELASNFFLSVNKANNLLENPGNLGTYASTAFFQAAIAAYGTYLVGQATKTYLVNGCSWGPWGASTAIEAILEQMDPQTPIYRLLKQKIGSSQGNKEKNQN